MMEDYRIVNEDIRFLLEARCNVHNLLLNSNDMFTEFSIKEKSTSRPRIIQFKQNLVLKCNVIRVTEKHLISLYNPGLLFSVFDCLGYLNKISNLKFSIFNDELIIVNHKPPENFIVPNDLFEKIFLKFDLIYRTSKIFKIQLALDNCFAINRCLKVSPWTLNQILDLNDNSLNFIVHLAIAFFDCFLKAPVCCRMQSIADNATVYDFDIFSHFYLIKNRPDFVKLSKKLFPFILNVEGKMLERDYLEIVPVNLIHLREPKHIIALIDKYEVFKSQSNGMFTVGNIPNISAKDLFNDLLTGQEVKCFDYLERAVNFSFGTDEERFLKDFTEFLKKVLYDEGIFLTLENQKRESFSFVSISTIEDSVLEREQLKDYFCYNIKPLKMFFAKMMEMEKNGDLQKGTSCEVTQYGSIILNNYCEIKPETFLLVRDSKIFLKEIVNFCDNMVCDPDTHQSKKQLRDEIQDLESRSELTDDNRIKLFENRDNLSRLKPYLNSMSVSKQDFIYHVHPKYQNLWELYSASKLFLCNVARRLNTVLKHLEDKDFELQSFLCVPDGILGFLEKEQSVTENALEKLREKHHIKITVFLQADIFQLECLQYKGLPQILRAAIDELENIKSFLEVVEEINESLINKGKLITFKISGEMCIVDNEQFFHYEVNNSQQRSNGDDLKKCLKIIYADKQNARLLLDTHLIFENYMSVTFHNFLFFETNRNELYEAAKLYKNLRKSGAGAPDHWISLKSKENLYPTTIFDNYVELIRILNPILFAVETELLVNEYFKILPQNIIPYSKMFGTINSKSTLLWEEAVSSLLLNKLKSLRSESGLFAYLYVKPSIIGNGIIQTKCFQLPASKWLQLSNFSNFVITAIHFSMNYVPIIHSTGLLGFQSDERSEIYLCFLEDKKIWSKLMLNQYLRYLLDPQQRLSFVINCNGDIKVGKFIWFRLSLGTEKIEDILRIIADFDDSFVESNETLMKSLSEFEHHQKEAMELAKLFNPMLTDFSETVIRDQRLKIFPCALHATWHQDEDSWCTAYKKLKNVFEMFKKKSWMWFLKHNGHFEIESYLIVTLDHLLNIQDFINFEKLVKNNLRKHVDNKLICKEEIMYGKNREEQTYNTVRKTLSAVAARNSIKEVFKLRFESNLTFLLNYNLWIRPEDFVDDIKNQLIKISKLIKTNFGMNSRFQFGTPGNLMAKSLLQKDSEQFYEYSQNVSNYISEKYPNDTNLIRTIFNDDNSQVHINNLLWINSRTFFHLSKFNDAMDIFVEYKDIELSYPFSDKAKKFLTDLKKIKDNRLEFDTKRIYCLKLIAEIFLKQKAKNPNYLKDQLQGEENEIYGIENLEVGGEKIFANGTVYIFLDQNNSFAFDDNVILLAHKYAEYLSQNDERNKCKRLFDFSSVVEIVYYYCLINTENEITENDKLLKQEPPKNVEEIFLNEENFTEMTNFLKTQINLVKNQQMHYKFVFQKRYELKGLHHWLKHGQDFDNIIHYYKEMNDFFTENFDEFSSEMDVQNGGLLNRNYKIGIYEGALMIPVESLSEGKFEFDVVRFQKSNKNIEINDFKKQVFNKFLIFTDQPFSDNKNSIMHYDLPNDANFIDFTEEEKINGKKNYATLINIKNMPLLYNDTLFIEDKIFKHSCTRVTVEQAEITLTSNVANPLSPDSASFQIVKVDELELFNYVVFPQDSLSQEPFSALKTVANIAEKIDDEEAENIKYILIALSHNVGEGTNSVGINNPSNLLQQISEKFNEAKIVVFSNTTDILNFSSKKETRRKVKNFKMICLS